MRDVGEASELPLQPVNVVTAPAAEGFQRNHLPTLAVVYFVDDTHPPFANSTANDVALRAFERVELLQRVDRQVVSRNEKGGILVQRRCSDGRCKQRFRFNADGGIVSALRRQVGEAIRIGPGQCTGDNLLEPRVLGARHLRVRVNARRAGSLWCTVDVPGQLAHQPALGDGPLALDGGG